MKNCKVVQDLMPSYVEKLTSEESNKFIEEHLKECNKCTNILKSMKADIKLKKVETPKEEIDYMKKAKKKMNISKKILILIIILIFTLILLFCRDIYKIYAYIDITNKFDKTLEEVNKSNNYVIVGTKIDEIYTYLYKDGRSKAISSDLQNETEAVSWQEFDNDKIINYYYNSDKKYISKTCLEKSPVLSKGIQELSISQIFIGKLSKWEEFKLNISSIVSISPTKYKDYIPAYLVRTNSKNYYVSRETGCILNDENMDYTLKFNIVTDKQIDFPNENEDYIILIDEVGKMRDLSETTEQISNCDELAGTIVDYDFKVLNEESELLSELKKSEIQEDLYFVKIVNKDTYDRYRNKWKKLRELTEEDFEHYFAIIVIDKNNKEDISFNSIEKAENNTATIKVDRKENEEDYKYSGSLIIMPNSVDSIHMVGTNVDFVN